MTANTEIGTSEAPTTLAKAAAGLEGLAARREEQAAAQVAVAATRDTSQRKSAARTRRTALGGAQLKLEVTIASLPGFHLFWENDTDNRLERLLQEGFEFCTPEEVGMARTATRVVVDSEITDRVSRHVGATDEGKPMRAFLMKCPLDLWEEIQDSISDLADSRDRDILESSDRGGERYQPKGYETKITSGLRR